MAALRFPFGLDKATAIVELRSLADGLEGGAVILQELRTGEKASADDFALKTVEIIFAEKRQPKEDA